MDNRTLPFQNLQPYISQGVRITWWFFPPVVAVIFLFHGLLSIAHPYSLDYGEAPLIDQAVRLATGENIYRPDLSTPPFTIANYPPLYVLSLLPTLDWLDNPFHLARAVSFAAAILSAVFIGLTVQALTEDRFAALTAFFFFLASPYIVKWSGRARIDMLALAFATAALFVFARWPRQRGVWVAGGLLLVAAAYTRQSYALAAPLAGFVWLWTQDRRRAIGLALLVGGLGLGLFLLLNALTGGGFFYNIVTANINEFGWERLRNHLSGLWDTHWPALTSSLIFLALGWRNLKPWPLLAAFLVGAFASALTIGKIGSNVNYFLELAAALALVAGMLIVWSKPHPWRHAAAVFLVTYQMGMMMQASMGSNVDFDLAQRSTDVTALMLLEQEVKGMQDPVLADEYMGMLTQNSRPLYLQPFEVSQLANQGDWDQGPLLADIRSGIFGGILIHHFGPFGVFAERWTPEMLAAIETHYRPVRTLAGTVVFEPRDDGGASILGQPQAFSEVGSVEWDGSIVALSQPGFYSAPTVAANPTNPDHLASLSTRFSKLNCELPNCLVELVYHDSTDGGRTWNLRSTYSFPQQIINGGQVAFDPDGVLYMLGIRNNVVTVNRTTEEENYQAAQPNFEEATRAQVFAQPWLQVDPESGEVVLTFDAQEGNRLYVTPSLIKSPDGVNWSTTLRADQHVSAGDIFTPRATGPVDIRALFGERDEVMLVWVWDWVPWTWPRTVWTARSVDGGRTFGEPTPILETWGPINVASGSGRYAIAYRSGSADFQQVAIAASQDGGRSWGTAIASGDVPLYFDADGAPGIAIAPDGTIDLAFHAHAGEPGDCLLDLQSWQNSRLAGWLDNCSYNIFYTFSRDGGRSFAEPLQLNREPIEGQGYVTFQGFSTGGYHLSIAAADAYALPAWVETLETGGTRLVTTRIER